MGGRFAENPAYVEYETRLKRLHALIAQGLGDDAEADAIRDAMDAPERHLSRAEVIRLNGLSADLYMLHGAEVLQPLNGESLDVDALREQLQEAKSWNDWEWVLGLLRRRNRSVPEEAVAATRARAYDMLGHADTALMFLDHAFRATPTDPAYQAMRLLLLSSAGRMDEALPLAQETLSSTPRSALLHIVSADVVITAGRLGRDVFPGPADAPRLLDALNRALRLPITMQDAPPDLQVLGHLLRAACFEALGQVEAAIQAAKDALALDPGDEQLRRFVALIEAPSARPAEDRALTMLLDHARTAARNELWPSPVAA